MTEEPKAKIEVEVHMAEAVFREAWISIKANKLRSFLTTLGIIIGVCAVVIMVAAGQTVQIMINKNLSDMGSNLLIVVPEFVATGGVRGSNRALMTTSDAELIKKLKHVKAVSPIVSGTGQLVYGNENHAGFISATTPDYIQTANWEIEEGQAFTERDVKSASSVVLIGATIKNELFKGEDPVGKTLRIKNVPFTVKGLLKAKGQNMTGQDQDDVVAMPHTTYRRKIRGSYIPDRVNYIVVQVNNENNIPKVTKEIELALRDAHRLKPNTENDFDIRDMTEIQETIRSVGTYLSILLASIASISLIVGSIGIMNMMLVSVTERTREIGIRKAIGAKNSAIMGQFLLEAILISFIGSMVGMLLGIGLSQIAGAILERDVPISMITVIISFSVAIVVGISSGLFPAIKATKLDPIEALRYQ